MKKKSSIFNYGRNEVKNFLLSSALFWLDKFHVDVAYRLSQIIVDDAALAEKVRNELLQGGIFEDLAVKYSTGEKLSVSI